MTNRCRTGTSDCNSRELDRELSDVLIAISVVSRRIADRISAVSGGEKNMEGGTLDGESKRIIHAR
ncbi:MAG: hypothetical protein RR670_01975 [Erysipelotrichaceae bacterium]